MSDKKSNASLTILIIICLSIVSVHAQLSENQIRENVENLENAREKVEDLSSKEFLREEWTEVLQKTKIGRILIEFGNVLSALNPILIRLIGIEYSFSWLFFLSLITAIAIFIIIYRPIKDFFDINSIFAIIITLTILSLISIKKTIPTTLESMSFLVSSLWLVLIAIIMIYGLSHIYWIISKRIGKDFREQRKKELEKERELRDKTIDKVKEMKLKSGNI